MVVRTKIFNTDDFVPKYNRNGYDIIRDAYSKDEAMRKEIFYHKCKSTNILIQKGDGYQINWADFMALFVTIEKKDIVLMRLNTNQIAQKNYC